MTVFATIGEGTSDATELPSTQISKTRAYIGNNTQITNTNDITMNATSDTTPSSTIAKRVSS